MAKHYNIADLYEMVADRVPTRSALVCGDQRATFAELDQRANKLAHYLLSQGVEQIKNMKEIKPTGSFTIVKKVSKGRGERVLVQDDHGVFVRVTVIGLKHTLILIRPKKGVQEIKLSLVVRRVQLVIKSSINGVMKVSV